MWGNVNVYENVDLEENCTEKTNNKYHFLNIFEFFKYIQNFSSIYIFFKLRTLSVKKRRFTSLK